MAAALVIEPIGTLKRISLRLIPGAICAGAIMRPRRFPFYCAANRAFQTAAIRLFLR